MNNLSYMREPDKLGSIIKNSQNWLQANTWNQADIQMLIVTILAVFQRHQWKDEHIYLTYK